jgi:predicted O-linked N-acetylglucosamine transferase (SPINDLY family)
MASRHYEQAVCAKRNGNLDESELHYRLALRSDPRSSTLLYNLGLLLLEVGDTEGAIGAFRQCLEVDPGMQVAHSSLLAAYDYSGHANHSEVLTLHLEWARKYADPLAQSRNRTESPLAEGERLRIGYISGDFCRHVISRFIEPVLRCHDRSKFRIFCFNSGSREDDMTMHLRGIADVWRDVRDLSDEALADQIHEDGIHILVDLSGHSAGNRLLALARKPAPVQMTWMGYLNTTGMNAIDYRITDYEADPPGTEMYYKEAFIRLPQPQWCYAPIAGPVVNPQQPVLPRQTDLPVRFGCMTRFMKISVEVIDAWIRILGAVPDSTIRIIDVPRHARGEELIDRFRIAGMQDRLELFPSLVADDYWKCISEIDIALDTFPYTGATTTCDCLWMGVPVVTRTGCRGVERSATSLLSAIGLSSLCGHGIDEYIDIAVSLARDRPLLASLRAGMRSRILASPICDPRAFTSHLEKGYLGAWSNRAESGVQSCM